MQPGTVYRAAGVYLEIFARRNTYQHREFVKLHRVWYDATVEIRKNDIIRVSGINKTYSIRRNYYGQLC